MKPLPHVSNNLAAAKGGATHSALIAARLPLSSCVRAYLTRSTLGAELSHKQRHNYFPASPLCGITWLLHGESQIIRRGDDNISEPLPTVSFSGPHTVPTLSVNPGPVNSFTVILIPQAIQAMTEIALEAYVNRVVPLSTLFDGPWQALSQAVMQAPDDGTRVKLIENFLEPRWNSLRFDSMPRADRHRYWIEGLALNAATSGMGKSLRQVERRIKQWAGLPLRDLRRLARGEESFHQARAAVETKTPNWADIAAQGGYSDQPHFCRETRRITGLSPNELRRAMDEDESFWLYRLWI